MKIVHIVDYLMPKMGYQELLLPKWHARHGHEVHIITSDRFFPVPNYAQTWGNLLGPRICGTGVMQIYHVTLHRLPCTCEWKGRTWISGLERKIYYLKPDVIFCHGTGSPTAIRVAIFCKRFGFPLLMDNHMIKSAKNNKLSGRLYYAVLKLLTRLILLRRCYLFLGVAQECCDFLEVEQGIPKHMIENLPLGVDTDVLKVDDVAGIELRAKLNIPSFAKVVLQTGKLTPDKGPHLLSQAMAPVMKQNSDVWLVFLGAGQADYLNTVIKPIKEHGVIDRLKIIPFVPFSDLAEFYNMSDLCVYPAAASMSCLEAAACGRSSIIADLPVGKWRAEKGVGICYSEGDVEELKKNIIRILHDDSGRVTMGQRARESVLAHFSYDSIARQAEELMCQAIEHSEFQPIYKAAINTIKIHKLSLSWLVGNGSMKNIARKVKRIAKAILGKDYFFRIDYLCQKARFGSQYGGWDVAVELIDKNSVVYSFGIGEDASFDIALIERFGVTVHAFDPTPKAIEWVKRQNYPTNFLLHKFGIANFDGKCSFNPPENPDHISHTILDRPETEKRSIRVPARKLSTIMKELGHSQIDIMKMDVEGAEFGVIEDIENSDIRPKQILVEFHHRFPNVGITKTREAIDKLKKMGYGLFSISTTGEEFCFINKSTNRGISTE